MQNLQITCVYPATFHCNIGICRLHHCICEFYAIKKHERTDKRIKMYLSFYSLKMSFLGKLSWKYKGRLWLLFLTYESICALVIPLMNSLIILIHLWISRYLYRHKYCRFTKISRMHIWNLSPHILLAQMTLHIRRLIKSWHTLKHIQCVWVTFLLHN